MKNLAASKVPDFLASSTGTAAIYATARFSELDVNRRRVDGVLLAKKYRRKTTKRAAVPEISVSTL